MNRVLAVLAGLLVLTALVNVAAWLLNPALPLLVTLFALAMAWRWLFGTPGRRRYQ